MTNSDLITLEKSDFPTGQISLSFYRPYYKDVRVANRHYPLPQDQSDQGPPYSMDDLIIAHKVVSINGNKVDNQKGDTIDRISSLDISDQQFLNTFFVDLCYASQEELRQARNKADEIKLDYRQSYTIPAEEIPSGEFSVTFRRPNAGVRMEVDRRWQSRAVNGCSMEEMLLAYCLEQINGEDKSQKPKDVVSLLEDWEIADVQFLASLFVGAFTMDTSEAESARDLAKKKKKSRSDKSGKKQTKPSQASAAPSTDNAST